MRHSDDTRLRKRVVRIRRTMPVRVNGLSFKTMIADLHSLPHALFPFLRVYAFAATPRVYQPSSRFAFFSRVFLPFCYGISDFLSRMQKLPVNGQSLINA